MEALYYKQFNALRRIYFSMFADYGESPKTTKWKHNVVKKFRRSNSSSNNAISEVETSETENLASFGVPLEECPCDELGVLTDLIFFFFFGFWLSIYFFFLIWLKKQKKPLK